MTARPPRDAGAASAALSAFLRGVERRADVFAYLQAGDARKAADALVGTVSGFRDVAARTPFGDWARRFWALLLASPHLREPSPSADWPDAFQALRQVGRGPRAALLLRLVAHVSEADAAAVLGVSRPTYRLALRRALPRREDGSADAAAWQALGEAARQAVRDLPPARLGELARLRDAVLQGQAYVPTPEAPPPSVHRHRRPRWLRPALVAVAVATLAAFAATFVPRGPSFGPDDGPAQVRSETLPPRGAPASTYDADLALLTHPDFDLLVATEEPAATDPAFHAWLVHQLDGMPDSDIVRAEREETAADVDESAIDADVQEFDDVP